jgi:hypothetical protein
MARCIRRGDEGRRRWWQRRSRVTASWGASLAPPDAARG